MATVNQGGECGSRTPTRRLSYASPQVGGKRKGIQEEGTERLTMRSIREADPGEPILSSSNVSGSANEWGEGEGGDSGDILVPYCVPRCVINALIDTRTSQHKCKHCTQHFHAICAFQYSQSHDVDDCGCERVLEQRWHKSDMVHEEGQGGQEEEIQKLPKGLSPPGDLIEEEVRVWFDGV